MALSSNGSAPLFARDALLRGRIPLAQPVDGYRTNVDALWLASFAGRPRVASRVLDLGAGVGVIGMLLLVRKMAHRATLLEFDPDLLKLAEENVISAGLADRVDLVHRDLRKRLPEKLNGSFDLVVANPPFGVEGAARKSPNGARARARIGDEETLELFARAARVALGAKGRACFVYPASDLARLVATLRGVGLEPKRMRLVHPLPDIPARVVLLEAKPGRPGGLRVEPPLIAMTAPGVWSDEARATVEGDEVEDSDIADSVQLGDLRVK